MERGKIECQKHGDTVRQDADGRIGCIPCKIDREIKLSQSIMKLREVKKGELK